jgi:hypothetical protein
LAHILDERDRLAGDLSILMSSHPHTASERVGFDPDGTVIEFTEWDGTSRLD